MAKRPKNDVGFRRPPRESQFKKGQSGNPDGRPKGSKNTRKVIAEVLDERIPVTANGKRKIISKRRAMATQMVNKAAAGDLNAASRVMAVVEPYESDLGSDGFEALSPEDSATLRIIAQILPDDYGDDDE